MSIVLVSNEVDSIKVVGIGYRPPAFNVALHKPITIAYAGRQPLDTSKANPSAIVDGNYSTWLIIEGRASGYDNSGTTIVLSLNKSYDIERIRLAPSFQQPYLSFRVRGYQIYVSNDSIAWDKLLDVPANSLADADTTLKSPPTARYVKLVITQVDSATNQTIISELEVYGSESLSTSVARPAEPHLSSFVLSQNYPNPYNPTTVIMYDLPTPSMVSLKVFDILGREVATLVNEQQHNGSHIITFDGTNLSSGIYFYQLQAGRNRKVMKMMLLK